MNILTLDCGTKTGWASSINGNIESGVQDFSLKRGESSGMRYLRFRAWLNEIIKLIKPNLVVYEMTFSKGQSANEILNTFAGIIQMECVNQNIDYTSVFATRLKKFATGSGKSNKDEMLRLAKYKFKRVIIDHNEADALWILEWAKEEFGD